MLGSFPAKTFKLSSRRGLGGIGVVDTADSVSELEAIARKDLFDLSLKEVFAEVLE